ncbi:hypothetical protein [Actinoplanes sp. NPDC049265]|uniref:hypothetical protein n=1 Tax=Actinoplanes sp. NPDC049265 TaxID=3363902 RepID=UPI003717AC0B
MSDDPFGPTRAIRPPAPPPSHASRWPWVVLIAAVVFTASGIWYAYQHDMIVPDSGIRACEALAAGDKSVAAQDRDNNLTMSEYKHLRQVFARSRHRDIRDHGTKLIDVAWQMSRSPDDDLSALAYLGPLVTHLTGLQSACADQGIFINLTPPATNRTRPRDCAELFPSPGRIMAPRDTHECTATDGSTTLVTARACSDGRLLFELIPNGGTQPTTWGFGGDKPHPVDGNPLTDKAYTKAGADCRT